MCWYRKYFWSNWSNSVKLRFSRVNSRFFEQAQANGVEGAEVHFVQIELDAQLGQSVGDAGSELARCLIGESDDQQRLGRDSLVRDEIDDTLDKGERFSGARTRDYDTGPSVARMASSCWGLALDWRAVVLGVIPLPRRYLPSPCRCDW